jgi:hypothetical protein
MEQREQEFAEQTVFFFLPFETTRRAENTGRANNYHIFFRVFFFQPVLASSRG